MYKYSAVLWFSLTEEDFISKRLSINSCVFIFFFLFIFYGGLVYIIIIIIITGNHGTYRIPANGN